MWENYRSKKVSLVSLALHTPATLFFFPWKQEINFPLERYPLYTKRKEYIFIIRDGGFWILTLIFLVTSLPFTTISLNLFVLLILHIFL